MSASQIGHFSHKMTGGRPPGLLTSYQNGHLPLQALDHLLTQTHLGAGAYFAKGRGKYIDLMVRDAKKKGVVLKLKAGYRDFAGQVYMKAYWTARGKPNNAAEPGHSNHGLAFALDWDIHSAGVENYLRQNGPTYGIDYPEWAIDGQGTEEHWHMQGIEEWDPSGISPEIKVYLNGVLAPSIEAFLDEKEKVWVEVREVVESGFKGILEGFPKGGVEVGLPDGRDAELSFLNVEGVGYTQASDLFDKLEIPVTWDSSDKSVHIGEA